MENAAPKTSPPDADASTRSIEILRVKSGGGAAAEDLLAVEEPLEIRLAWHTARARRQRPIAITMRTPGHDFELAAGFLYSEGIIRAASDISAMYHAGPMRGGQYHNTVRVVLRQGLQVETQRLRRHFYTTSSCGVCGKASIELLQQACPAVPGDALRICAETLWQLPARQRAAQAVFDRTGGLHSAALFDAGGRLLFQREDVGRHNALDKVVGRCLLDNALPAAQCVLLLSGRASFELVQKAAMAGVPVVAAVGAPSSLAVETAAALGLTLLGFLRDQRFNIYAHPERIATGAG